MLLDVPAHVPVGLHLSALVGFHKAVGSVPVFPPALSRGPLVVIPLVLRLRLVLVQAVLRPALWPPLAVSALLGVLAGVCSSLLYPPQDGRIG